MQNTNFKPLLKNSSYPNQKKKANSNRRVIYPIFIDFRLIHLGKCIIFSLMAAFKKMAIIPIEELERLKQKQISSYNPTNRTLALLQEEIDSALYRKDLSSDEKIKLLQVVQCRYRGIAGKQEEPDLPNMSRDLPLPKPPEKSVEPKPAEDKIKTPITSRLIHALPHQYQNKARAIIDHLGKNPYLISVNDKLEVIIKGRTLPASNIIDLISDLF